MKDKKHHHQPHQHSEHCSHGANHGNHKEQDAVAQEELTQPFTTAYKQSTKKVDQEESLVQESLGKLEQQLEKAQNDAKEYWEMSLRLQAELQNIQRRAEQNVEKAHKFGLEKFAEAMLPAVDSLEKGLENTAAAQGQGDSQVETIRHGCELTLKILLDTLKKFNVEPIDAEGRPFDPAYHEAMLMQESNAVAPNTVLTVIQKGYTLNGRVIRPARVIVSKTQGK